MCKEWLKTTGQLSELLVQVGTTGKQLIVLTINVGGWGEGGTKGYSLKQMVDQVPAHVVLLQETGRATKVGPLGRCAWRTHAAVGQEGTLGCMIILTQHFKTAFACEEAGTVVKDPSGRWISWKGKTVVGEMVISCVHAKSGAGGDIHPTRGVENERRC